MEWGARNQKGIQIWLCVTAVNVAKRGSNNTANQREEALKRISGISARGKLGVVSKRLSTTTANGDCPVPCADCGIIVVEKGYADRIWMPPTFGAGAGNNHNSDVYCNTPRREVNGPTAIFVGVNWIKPPCKLDACQRQWFDDLGPHRTNLCPR